MKRKSIFLLVALFIASVCVPLTGIAETERGLASYYADNLHGNKTASGEAYDKNALTAAHRTHDFGSWVTVTYLKTGKTVEVRINDRGPYVKERIIDLSGAAADQLGLKEDGVGEVSIGLSRGP